MEPAFSDALYLIVALSLIFNWLFVFREMYFFYKISDIFRRTTVDLKNMPRVSVIVPAKNEAPSIRQCLDSLSRQTYKNFECVLVNDRSEDSTAIIMEEFAERYPHFTAISIHELPEGWLGKTHALQQGANLASGEYLLFTDGDVIFEKETLAKTVQFCLNNNLDHLCLVPKLHAKRSAEASLYVIFGVLILLSVRPSKMKKRREFYAGIGAFNLVKHHAYQTVGEHEKLRLEVCDDMILGKSLTSYGFSSALVYGEDCISLTWYDSIKDIIVGLEKNGFAAMEYSILMFITISLYILYSFFFPFVLIFYSPPLACVGFMVAILIMQSTFWVAARKQGYNSLVSLLVPFSIWIFYFSQLRSVFLSLVRRKVIWRETAYSLKELKSKRKQLSRELRAKRKSLRNIL